MPLHQHLELTVDFNWTMSEMTFPVYIYTYFEGTTGKANPKCLHASSHKKITREKYEQTCKKREHRKMNVCHCI